MNGISQATISGVGTVSITRFSTNQAVVDDYLANVLIIQGYLYKQYSGTSVPSSDLAQFNQAVSNLKKLSKDGLIVNGAPCYITSDMATQLDTLFRSLDSAGISPTASSTTLLKWKDLGISGVDAIVQRAAYAADMNRSLQAMIELEYVKTGNDVFSAQLQKLYDAMNLNNTTLNDLSSLMELRTETTASQTVNEAFGVPNGQDLSSVPAADFQTQNIDQTLTNSNTPIQIVVNWGSPPNVDDILNRFTELRTKLANDLTKLDQLTPPTANGRDPSSLAGKVAKILDDINVLEATKFTATGSDPLVLKPQDVYTMWIVDRNNDIDPLTQVQNTVTTLATQFVDKNSDVFDEDDRADLIKTYTNGIMNLYKADPTLSSYSYKPAAFFPTFTVYATDLPSVGNINFTTKGTDYLTSGGKGSVSQDISGGMTAASNLNSQQQQLLRQSMFVFEEFYKSASGLLSSINDLVVEMAKNSGQ